MNAQAEFAKSSDRVLTMIDEQNRAAEQRRDAQIAASLSLESEIDRCMAALADMGADARSKRGAA